MADSLQEQLLKAGLADAKQAKKGRKGKPSSKAKKSQRGLELSEAAIAAQQKAAEKAERDRVLNLERKAEADRKALDAQVNQLIEQNRISREDAEDVYHFVDEGKVRSLLVTPALREQLSKGGLEIVRFGGGYELVPAEAAEKIRVRVPERIVAGPPAEQKSSNEDPYADYQVPDDLMW